MALFEVLAWKNAVELLNGAPRIQGSKVTHAVVGRLGLSEAIGMKVWVSLDVQRHGSWLS